MVRLGSQTHTHYQISPFQFLTWMKSRKRIGKCFFCIHDNICAVFLILFRKFSLNYPICFWIWLIDFHFYLHIVFTLTSIDIKKATFLDLYFSKKFGGPSVHGDWIGWGLTAVCPERPMNWAPIVWDQMSGEHIRLGPNVLQSLQINP